MGFVFFSLAVCGSCPARGGHDGLQSCSFHYDYPQLLPHLELDTQLTYVSKLQAMLATVLQVRLLVRSLNGNLTR